MIRIRPSVEALDSRTLLSVAPIGPVGPTFEPVAVESTPPADEAARVTVQDIHFTTPVSKSSPK